MQIKFRDSQIASGGRARIADSQLGPQQGEATLEFSDGSSAQAQFNCLSNDEIQLWVRPYITAQGNAVSSHDWRIERTSAKGVWKVSRRGA